MDNGIMNTSNDNQGVIDMTIFLIQAELFTSKTYSQFIASPIVQKYADALLPMLEAMDFYEATQVYMWAGPQDLDAATDTLANAYVLAKAACKTRFLVSFNNRVDGLPAWSSQVFVDSLEIVDIATIEQEDMRCFHCWNDFGITMEDESPEEFAVDMNEEDPELWEILSMFRELPFCECKVSNDPVRTPCGHLVGYSCLVDILEATGNTACPMCRQDICADWTRTSLPCRH